MVGFYYGVLMVLVFFFKQKTAYDMRISDWSSDVCSSDLDPTSAFGGIIAFNRELDADTAKLIVERQFVEVIIAPRISAAARQIVAAKQNVRLLERSEEHTSELKSLMRNSYADFCLNKTHTATKKATTQKDHTSTAQT